MLYSVEAGATQVEDAVPLIMKLLSISKKNAQSAAAQANEVFEKLAELDPMIAEFCTEYEFSRISLIERNILRLSFFEKLYGDLPLAVSIAEAKRLCKKFSTPEASKFVHGVLGEWESKSVTATTT